MARLVASAGARRAEVSARQDEGADVVDPFRQGPSVFQQMQAQINPPLRTVVSALRAAG